MSSSNTNNIPVPVRQPSALEFLFQTAASVASTAINVASTATSTAMNTASYVASTAVNTASDLATSAVNAVSASNSPRTESNFDPTASQPKAANISRALSRFQAASNAIATASIATKAITNAPSQPPMTVLLLRQEHDALQSAHRLSLLELTKLQHQRLARIDQNAAEMDSIPDENTVHLPGQYDIAADRLKKHSEAAARLQHDAQKLLTLQTQFTHASDHAALLLSQHTTSSLQQQDTQALLDTARARLLRGIRQYAALEATLEEVRLAMAEAVLPLSMRHDLTKRLQDIERLIEQQYAQRLVLLEQYAAALFPTMDQLTASTGSQWLDLYLVQHVTVTLARLRDGVRRGFYDAARCQLPRHETAWRALHMAYVKRAMLRHEHSRNHQQQEMATRWRVQQTEKGELDNLRPLREGEMYAYEEVRQAKAAASSDVNSPPSGPKTTVRKIIVRQKTTAELQHDLDQVRQEAERQLDARVALSCLLGQEQHNIATTGTLVKSRRPTVSVPSNSQTTTSSTINTFLTPSTTNRTGTSPLLSPQAPLSPAPLLSPIAMSPNLRASSQNQDESEEGLLEAAKDVILQQQRLAAPVMASTSVTVPLSNAAATPKVRTGGASRLAQVVQMATNLPTTSNTTASTNYTSAPATSNTTATTQNGQSSFRDKLLRFVAVEQMQRQQQLQESQRKQHHSHHNENDQNEPQ